jgi:two-component system, NarL family, sensor kinase
VRTMSYLLHPPLLDEVGLVSAVREYTDGFAARSGIRVSLDLPPSLGRLPTEAETALFRVMQESLANIHRHSGSPTAGVRLAIEDGSIRLVVNDAGHGIPPEKWGKDGSVSGMGVGIRGMTERVHQLGGQLHVDTGPTGTTVTATLPLGRTTP